MILQSSANRYEAINLIARTGSYSVYKCTGKGRSYIVYVVEDKELENKLVARFGDMTEQDLDGFAELFAENDALVLVFKEYVLEQTAASFNDDTTAESDKLMFFVRVLEAFCVHGVPCDIACDLLEGDNVGVSSEGSADCRYLFHNIAALEDRNMRSLCRVFIEKLKTALIPVGRTKRTAVIDKFCKELMSNVPQSMTDLYDRYEECVEICRQTELGETKLQRLKKKALKAASVGKVMLTVVILGLACVILAMSILKNNNDGGVYFDRVGEVEIESSASGSSSH